MFESTNKEEALLVHGPLQQSSTMSSSVTPVVPFNDSSISVPRRQPRTSALSAFSASTTSILPEGQPRARSKGVQFGFRLWDWWLGLLHVSHSGTYSIERILALEEYSHTSWLRVLAVCLLMPLPTLFFVVCIELLPLQSAFAGWKANYFFWVRHFILTVVTMECNALQLKRLLPDLPWRRSRVVALSLFTAAVSVSGAILISEVWVFPIPFFMVIVGIPFTSIWVKGFERMVLAELPNLAPDFKHRFDLANDLFNVQGLLVSVYPVYNALFVMLPSHLQPAFVFVLPVIKMILKKKVATRLVELEDYLPEEAVFTVELFNALYMVNCMQNTTTPVTSSVILGVDLVLSAFSLYGLNKRTNILQTLHRQHLDTVSAADGNVETQSLRELVLTLLASPDKIDKAVLAEVRVEACIPHLLRPSHRKLVQALVRVREQCPPPTAQPLARDPSRKRSLLEAVVPAHATSILHSLRGAPTDQALLMRGLLQPTPSQQLELSQRQKSRLLQQTLRAMFNVEFLVLIEFVECMIPVMYAIYLPVLVSLPNGKFYPHSRALQHDHERLRTVISNIVLFAILEIASLAVLCWILRRRFKLSPLHQLAFVLENQTALIQGKLIVWLIYSLQFTIDHQGADFTFRFKWLNQ